MATAQLGAVLRHLRRLAADPKAGEPSDGSLLQAFLGQNDQSAFESLLLRHGPMVLRVCRRTLGNTHDAEDAFQATFLVLARQAASIRKRESLASWLHGVAYRMATHAKRSATRRRGHESRISSPQPRDPALVAAWQELQALFDEEIAGLPETLRTPFVFCCLENLSCAAAAQQLGVQEATVWKRLSRARNLLRERLTRRGVSLTAVLAAVAVGAGGASAALPRGLVGLTVEAVARIAAGQTFTGGTLSGKVLALVERMNQTMLVNKCKTAILLLCMAVLGTGLGMAVVRGRASAEPPVPAAPTSPETKPQVQASSPANEPRSETGTKTARLDSLGDPLPEGALARVGTNRLRADGPVTMIAFSNDCRLMAYGTESGIVHVCDAATGKPRFKIHPDVRPSSPFTELAFSPDGRTLAASGFWFKEVYLIDVDTQKVRHMLPNTTDGQENWSRCWQGPTLAFTPDGKTLIVGGKDGALHLWDPMKATEQAALAQTKDRVLSLTLTADGRTALTAHDGGVLHLWDLTQRKHLRKLTVSAKLPHFAAMAPDGQTVAVASSANEIESRNMAGGLRHRLGIEAQLVGLGFRPDGSLQVAQGNGTITIWDVRTGTTHSSFTCPGISTTREDGPSAWFESQGNRMAWEVAGTVRPWDLATRKETPRLSAYRRGVQWAGFTADGRWLSACGASGEVGVWSAATGRPEGTSHKIDVSWGVRCLRAADRGRVVIAAGDPVLKPKPSGGRIFLWDPTKGADPVPLRDQVAPVWHAALSPDQRFLVATELTGLIRVYDTVTGKPIRSFAGREFEYQPTFSPDGKLMATTHSGRTVRLYDFATGRVVRDFETPSGSSCLAFAPDGQSLATGHYNDQKLVRLTEKLGGQLPGDLIYLWDTASGRELWRIATGHDSVESLSFSPDGLLIASSGWDRVVHIWEAATGQERRRYDGHRRSVESVDFGPDGLRLASASMDGTALIWQVFDPAPAERTAAELNALWAELTRDGARAHRAIAALIAAKGTAAFLGTLLKPALEPPDEQVRKWVADLGSSEFETREAAQTALLRVGDTIEPALRRAQNAATDAEVRRRLDAMLEGIPALASRPDRLRERRAAEVLGHIDSSEARKVLAELAKGAPQAILTRQAKAGLAFQQRKQ